MLNQACDGASSRVCSQLCVSASKLCSSRDAETSFPSCCCVLDSALALGLEAAGGYKHVVVTNSSPLSSWWLLSCCTETTHCMSAVLHVSLPKELNFWGLLVASRDGQMPLGLCCCEPYKWVCSGALLRHFIPSCYLWLRVSLHTKPAGYR